MTMTVKRLMMLSLLVLAACGGDKKKDDDEAEDVKKSGSPAGEVSVADYQKKQAAFADSVLNASKPAKALVEKLGKGYDVGSVRLRDSVAFLAGSKTQCFQKARKEDPYLAGTVSMFVHISVIGSDVVRVQESSWTSIAGNLVDACLNTEAKNWKFDPTFGKPAAYIVQVQFK
jgi:hypothetical protein